MRPRIGITTRFRRSIRSHSVHEGYVDQVVRAGGLPVVVPTGDRALCGEVLAGLDGLLLTGGEDIDPAHAPGTLRQEGYDYQPERDVFEFRLAALALDRGLPTLGVCRGCQVLHVASGNPLIPHIPDVNQGLVAHRTSLTEPAEHLVTVVGGSRLAKAYDAPSFVVTSYHHQGLGEPDRDWWATAHSEDGLVEAVEYRGGGWAVGVLWHPELPPGADDGSPDPLVAAFTHAAGGA
ncbi:gamma-glutamyl-gamma-aminobutyrate hydrolase family protein [Longispora urticae]